MALIFQIANTLALFTWLIIGFAPKTSWSIKLARYGVVLLLSLAYVILIAPTLANFEPDSFSSLENVMALFTDPAAVTAGWLHYLAFDLFIGTWIIEEGQKLNIQRWKYTLCLPFAFMFGPAGLLLFYLFKFLKR